MRLPRMTRPLFVFSLLCAISAVAASPKAENPIKDEELIQGNWLVASVRQGREGWKKLPKAELAQMRFVITEKHISFGKIGQHPMGFN